MSTNTTITNNQQPIQVEGFPDTRISVTGGLNTQANTLMNVTAFRNQFPTMDGRGYSVAVIDTGINKNHPAFAGRIVAEYDFGDNDNDATDVNGHGTNVSSIIGSSNPSYLGVAPGVNIIPLKVFTNSGSGTMNRVERALRWVIDNAATYNIVSVNMSISDGMNHNNDTSLYGLNDELDILANQLGIIPVSASGNSFFFYNSQQGIAYPASDRNSLAVGAVFDRNMGRLATRSGAVAETSGPDVIAPFSQRHQNLTSTVSPGVQILGAAKTTSTGINTATSSYTGTSQASPQIAGIVALAQQFAQQTLGRRLTYNEIIGLLQSSGRTINDGDDENDNVINTGLDFKRVDMMALAQGIQAMAGPPTLPVTPPSNNLKITINGTAQNYTVGEYDPAQIGPYTSTIADDDTLLNVTGNAWLQVPINYTVTSNTVLKFDFLSSQLGEIQGIGFDTDNLLNSNDNTRSFQVYGNQPWGRNNYQYTNIGNWQSFTIPVGSVFTGAFQQLLFINDHDVANPNSNSQFRNVEISG